MNSQNLYFLTSLTLCFSFLTAVQSGCQTVLVSSYGAHNEERPWQRVSDNTCGTKVRVTKQQGFYSSTTVGFDIAVKELAKLGITKTHVEQTSSSVDYSSDVVYFDRYYYIGMSWMETVVKHLMKEECCDDPPTDPPQRLIKRNFRCWTNSEWEVESRMIQDGTTRYAVLKYDDRHC